MRIPQRLFVLSCIFLELLIQLVRARCEFFISRPLDEHNARCAVFKSCIDHIAVENMDGRNAHEHDKRGVLFPVNSGNISRCICIWVDENYHSRSFAQDPLQLRLYLAACKISSLDAFYWAGWHADSTACAGK